MNHIEPTVPGDPARTPETKQPAVITANHLDVLKAPHTYSRKTGYQPAEKE
jgi:hypothetical protein